MHRLQRDPAGQRLRTAGGAEMGGLFFHTLNLSGLAKILYARQSISITLDIFYT
jgi:hypothetical protein